MVKECSAGHISSSAPEGGHTFRLPGIPWPWFDFDGLAHATSTGVKIRAACEDFARALPYALLFGGCPSNLARVDWRTSTDLDVSQQTSGCGALNAPCRLMGTNPAAAGRGRRVCLQAIHLLLGHAA